MARCADRYQKLSRVLALLVVVAASGCDNSRAVDEIDASPPPGDTGSKGDAGIDRADVGEADASSDLSVDDGASDDASSTDAKEEDRSPQDRTSDDRRMEGGGSDADARVDALDADVAVHADGDADAAGHSDRGVDAVDADVLADSDPDGGCACTPDEQGAMGIVPLACFCTGSRCPSFDDAINRCPDTQYPDGHRIDTYADCNLIVINIVNPIGIGGSAYAYDATTHELVGGMFSADYPAFSCGTTAVFGHRAGTFPPTTCALTQSTIRCLDGGDGG